MGEAKRRAAMNGPQFNQLRPGQQIMVDLTNAVPKACKNPIGKVTEMGLIEHECGCKFFIPVVQVYTVSALVSPTGQELTAQQPVLVCMECKAVLK